ncbi:hypothetical protein, partial [Pantoea rodasii]|uniref:hypothetical protein n=1 Tax=Pantoea rodasii TaxID=1076549 RepID=UPI001B804EC7
SLLQSQTLFSAFFLRRGESLHSLLSRLRCRFAVSVVAHYRDPNFCTTPFFDLFNRLASFRSFR